jgi:hypothetical protein
MLSKCCAILIRANEKHNYEACFFGHATMVSIEPIMAANFTWITTPPALPLLALSQTEEGIVVSCGLEGMKLYQIEAFTIRD